MCIMLDTGVPYLVRQFIRPGAGAHAPSVAGPIARRPAAQHLQCTTCSIYEPADNAPRVPVDTASRPD